MSQSQEAKIKNTETSAMGGGMAFLLCPFKCVLLCCLLFLGTQATNQARIEDLKVKIAELEIELARETSSVILPDFTECDYAPIMSWHIHLSFHANGGYEVPTLSPLFDSINIKHI